MKWIVLPLIALTLAGCDEPDRRPCIKSHEELVMMPSYNGVSFIMVPTYDQVCDKHEGDK